jgi:ketosteroid isomerase-like protein
MANKSLTELIRIYFKAYETKDRSALESTLSDDFTFTSPHDNHIDRVTYLERCWPNSKHTKAIHIRKLFDQGNEAFVLYDFEPDNGQPFRNTEFFNGDDGKIKTIEVYFGSKIGRVEDIK